MFGLRLSLAVLIAAACCAPAFAAKLYKWTDENGKVHFSDRVPPEQVKQARSELNSQGVSVKQTERAKTPEEIAAAKAEAEEAARLQKIADEQRRSDETLINSYASEDDLKRAYEANLELIEQQIISTNADIDLRERNLEQLVKRASQSEQSGQKVDDNITKLIDNERQEIERQKAYILTKGADKAKAESDYLDRLGKYRAAVAKTRKPG